MTPPHRPSRSHPSAGYSMVEVLASLLLAAIVLPVALRGIAQGVRVTAVGADRLEATMLAEMKLNELLATGAFTSGDEEGDFSDYNIDDQEPRYAQYIWRSHAEDWDDDGAMQQVDVTVYWERSGTLQSVTLSTLAPTEEE